MNTKKRYRLIGSTSGGVSGGLAGALNLPPNEAVVIALIVGAIVGLILSIILPLMLCCRLERDRKDTPEPNHASLTTLDSASERNHQRRAHEGPG